MSDKIRFVSICNGVEIEIDPQDPEMPEDVRAYYRELSRQASAELDAGVTEMPEDSVPEFVTRYVRHLFFERIERIGQMQDETVKYLDPLSLSQYIGIRCLATAELVARELPEAGRGAITELGKLFGEAFGALIKHDDDWRRLTIDQARRLYVGTVMAVCCAMAADYNRMAERRDRAADGDGEGSK